MQMGIRHEKGSDQLRLSLPKDLKSYMEETYGIHEKFLYLENKISRMDIIYLLIRDFIIWWPVMILEMAELLFWEESIFPWKDIFIKKSPECSLYGMHSNQKEE